MPPTVFFHRFGGKPRACPTLISVIGGFDLLMRILRIKRNHPENLSDDRVLDLSGSGILVADAFAGAPLFDILCLLLYGRAPRSGDASLPPLPDGVGSYGFEVLFESGGEGTSLERYRAACPPDRGGEGLLSRTLHRIGDDSALQEESRSVEALTGISFGAFVRSSQLRTEDFSVFLNAEPGARAAILDALLGEDVYGAVASLAYEKYRTEKEERRAQGKLPVAGNVKRLRRELAEVLHDLEELEGSLSRMDGTSQYGDRLARNERELRDLERRKADWEKEMALFAPDRRRLEQARRALELTEAHRALTVLRKEQERDRVEQLNLKTELTRYRADMQVAEEAYNLAETTLRERLVQQKRLADTLRTVRDLDLQVRDRQEAVQEAREQFQAMEKSLCETSARAERERAELEKTGIALRDVRKHLQSTPADEKLSRALGGIRKCFDLFSQAQKNRHALKDAYERALKGRQNAQSALNDRQAMFSDMSHRFGVVEKNFERAQAFFGASLKGKSLEEWRESCSSSERRLRDMDRLAANLHRERELRDEMRELLDRRLKMELERRELGMREAEQAGRIERGEAGLQQLEKRVELLRRVDEMGEMRHLLQDSTPCPLCGALAHPYSGGATPSSDEARRQLLEASKDLEALKEDFVSRQSLAARLEEDILAAGRGEEELGRELALLDVAITEDVASLGLKLGIGVSPLEELDRARQKARDQLQRARDVLGTAEEAERELLAARDELERIRGSQEELTRFHQEALSGLKKEQAEVERLEKEIRGHEESFNSIRRELIGQISLFGYKNLPDENPRQLLDLLEARSASWLRREEEKEGLERTFCTEQAALNATQKVRDDLKAEAGSKAELIKRLETERDALQQQRVVLFASKDPQVEEARMRESVEDVRRQLELRREARNESRDRLEGVMIRLHDLETSQATRRELVQKEEIAFGKFLLAKGFRNEDDYLSACLPEEDRKELQDRLRDLSRAGFEIGGAQDDAKFAQAELRSLSIASGAAGELTDLTRLLDRAGTLYLDMGSDAEGEKIYREYGDALRRRVFFNAEDSSERKAAFRGYVRRLAFESILRRANARLARSGNPLRLLRGGDALAVLLEREGHPISLSGAEGRTASLALAWGLCDLSRWLSGGTDLRVWDGGPGNAEPEMSGLMNAFCGDGERVLLRN